MLGSIVLLLAAAILRTVCTIDVPVIGILSQETYSIQKYFPDEDYDSFIAASYVKFVESAGAKVVPIRIGQDINYYREIIDNTNGVLFPGGATWFNESGGYGDAGQMLYDLAVEANDNGKYYPLFGICLGMELMAQVAIGGQEIRAHCSASKLTLPLNFTKGFEGSKLFSPASNEIIDIFKEKVTYNSHQYCITKENFTAFGLSDKFDILAANKDRNDLEFISAFESKSYPFYSIQFHPEKNQFEFILGKDIPHSMKAVQMSQYFANFFVEEARKNDNSFGDWLQEQKALIYNYNPVFTGLQNSSYEQVYVFKNDKVRSKFTLENLVLIQHGGAN